MPMNKWVWYSVQCGYQKIYWLFFEYFSVCILFSRSSMLNTIDALTKYYSISLLLLVLHTIKCIKRKEIEHQQKVTN